MIEEKSNYYLCTCDRCGHVWETRWDWKKRTAKVLPKSCAKCKSKGWNSPRVYSGKYAEVTILKREKPTGRKAKLCAGGGSD